MMAGVAVSNAFLRASESPQPDSYPQAVVARQQAIAALRHRIRRCELRLDEVHQDEPGHEPLPSAVTPTATSTGHGSLDELLPAGRLRRGTLIEWMGEELLGGAVTVSLAAAARAAPLDRPILCIDAAGELFPPALEALGFDLSRLVIVRPTSEREAVWTCEESLRCDGVGLVWARLDRLSDTAFRRLQLAAEAGQGLGFLVRPSAARRQPSWAEVRLQVTPQPRGEPLPRYHLAVTYSQGRPRRSEIELRLDELCGDNRCGDKRRDQESGRDEWHRHGVGQNGNESRGVNHVIRSTETTATTPPHPLALVS